MAWNLGNRSLATILLKGEKAWNKRRRKEAVASAPAQAPAAAPAVPTAVAEAPAEDSAVPEADKPEGSGKDEKDENVEAEEDFDEMLKRVAMEAIRKKMAELPWLE